MADAVTKDAPAHDPIDMYKASVPVILNALGNLTHILNKARDWATVRKVDESVVLNARLALDMLPLLKQVQLVSDTAKGAAARLAGVDVPSFADTETSFDEILARIQKTADFVKSVPVEAFSGAESRTVTLKFGPRSMEFSGIAYLTGFVLPNLFFHVTTAYAILRHSGVPLGKLDYLNGGKS